MNTDYRKMFTEMENEPVTTLHKNSRVLIVDSLNTFLRSFVAIHHVNPAGNHVGGLGGFLKSIGAVIKQIQPTRVILVFDGVGGSTNKRYLYPEYKANRHITKISNWDAFDNQEEESESITNQILRLVAYLKCLPVDLIAIDKIEADDVIGYLATRFPEKVTILSTDQDYLQLVSDKISVYSPVKKIIYDPARVVKEYGITPQNFLVGKVILGDKGDNVPGVKGIGAKTLIKLFPQLKEEEKFRLLVLLEHAKQNITKSKHYGDILNFSYQLDINRKLMDLHSPNIPQEDKITIDHLLNNPNNEYDPTRFVKLYNEDLLGKTLLSPQIWLSETFAKLTQYKLKDQE
jgi:DNA polymerase-1